MDRRTKIRLIVAGWLFLALVWATLAVADGNLVDGALAIGSAATGVAFYHFEGGANEGE